MKILQVTDTHLVDTGGTIYGIDLLRPDERNRLADGLADIIGHGLFETAPHRP